MNAGFITQKTVYYTLGLVSLVRFIHSTILYFEKSSQGYTYT